MEGRGKSRRRNTRQEWKRRLSSALAVVLTAAMVLNMPLSIDSLGLHVSNAFASGSNADREGGLWATASNAKYQKGQSQDVDIYVIAEDNEAAPGNTSSMTLYLKNNTGQTITEGTLSFKGNHIAKEDGYFEDMGTAQADSPTVIVGGADPTKQTEASGEGMLYQEDGEDSKENIDGEASLGDQDGIAGGDDADADANDADDEDVDDEDAEEEESHKLTDIDLQPGEMREIRFTYYTDDEENSTKAYVEFSFHGEDENEAAVRSSSKFYYSIGLPFVNFSMEDGMQIESGVSNDMEIWMSEPTWVDEALEERIEKQEEEEAEKAYKDEETGTADTASSSNADKASDSNASKDTEDADTQKDQDKINQYKEEAMTISKVSYDVEIYGAELERFSPRKAEEVEDLGWISCIYEVANDTEPGVYYGKVTANGRWNNRKFTSEQGFLFEVTREGKTGQEFTKELDKVIVHAYAEEGVLEEGVKLTAKELRQEDAETAEQFNEAKDALDAEGTEYDGMMALDISFVDKDGQEVEPNGDVQVSIEMKKDALPEDIDLETVEVHHMKEVDNTVEVEPVADGADKTDGTVKSAEAAVAELKEAEVPKEEIEAAVSDEAVAVAEFSVGSFSTFTITWKSFWGGSRKVTLHLVTEDGSAIDEIKPNDRDLSTSENGIKVEEYAPFISLAYEYLGAEYNGKAITNIRCTQSFGFVDKWQYKTTERGNWIDFPDEDIDINLIYRYSETVVPPSEEQKLAHDKFAVRREDGSYDLTLTISGQVGSITNKAKLDVIYVLDSSGSMADKIGKTNKRAAASNAINTITNSLAENENLDVRFSLVKFSGDNGFLGFGDNSWNDAETLVEWTDNEKDITGKSSPSSDGGTNYQAGLREAQNLLESKREGAITAVIFISDGDPTFYYDASGKTKGDGSGYDSTALTYAKNTVKDLSCDYFYTVGVGNKDNYQRLEDLCEAATNATNTDHFAGTDEEALKEAFNDIEASVTTLNCSDVTVVDVLSQNVQIVETSEGEPKDLIISVKDNEGKIAAEGTSPLQWDGTKITASYNSRTKKITLDFADNYELKKGYTYQVTAHIEPTELAYEAFRQNGMVYLDTPDAGTGTHGPEKGQIENGFYSNADAAVTYTYNDVKKSESYKKPVIQLQPGELIIQKTINGLDDDELSKLEQKLQFKVMLNEEEEIIPLSNFKRQSDGTYQYSVKGLSPDTSYTIEEVNAELDGYNVKTEVAGNTGTVGRGETKNVSFTNTYIQARKLTILKDVTGNLGDVHANFSFTIAVERDGQDITEQIVGNDSTFTLKDKDENPESKKEITGLIPGDMITITETLTDGYRPSHQLNDYSFEEGNEIIVTLDENMPEDITITFQNEKKIETPTGIFSNNTPYAVLLAIAAVGSISFIYPTCRRKKRSADNQ